MKIYYLLVTFIFVILIGGCAGSNLAQNLITEYGEIHDYDLKSTYYYFDGSTEVKEHTYIKPEQATTAGLLNAIEGVARKVKSIKEGEYNGKEAYVLAVTITPTRGKSETLTQIYWIDKNSFFPLKGEMYIDGPDCLFEKLKKTPEIFNFVYGENAARDLGIFTNEYGYRLFTVEYEFLNINTRLDETVECEQYDERTGTCFIALVTVETEMLDNLEEIKTKYPDILLPTYMDNFNLGYLSSANTETIVDGYIHAEDIINVLFDYTTKFSLEGSCGKSTLYTHCTYGPQYGDSQTKISIYESKSPYLLLSHLPEGDIQEYEAIESTSEDGVVNEHIFIKSEVVTPANQGMTHTKRTVNLRWKEAGNYYLIEFVSEKFSNEIEELKDMSKEEIIKIAESMKPAQEIEV